MIFPPELQGQAVAVRYFASATGRYWVAYDSDNQAIAERFPDEDEGWINLLAMVEEEPLFNPDWDRELIGFGERDLVIVAETSGVDNFEFLFVHSEWATQMAQTGMFALQIFIRRVAAKRHKTIFPICPRFFRVVRLTL
jgi:hypothetical protein